jgi:hypothetical protein
MIEGKKRTMTPEQKIELKNNQANIAKKDCEMLRGTNSRAAQFLIKYVVPELKRINEEINKLKSKKK